MATEKVLYEQSRRKRVTKERRIFQVMNQWLQVMYPEVYEEFNNFFTQLDEKNPNTRNLSLT